MICHTVHLRGSNFAFSHEWSIFVRALDRKLMIFLQNSLKACSILKKQSSLLNKIDKNLINVQEVRQNHGKTCGPVECVARNRSLVIMQVFYRRKTQCDSSQVFYFYNNTAASPIQVSSPIGCQAKMQSPGWSSLTWLIKKLGKHAQQSSQMI